MPLDTRTTPRPFSSRRSGAIPLAFLLLPAAPALAVTFTPETLSRFTGRLHPVIVHFPIALLVVALLFELTSLLIKGRARGPSPLALACLVPGAIGAALAAWAGWLNADLEPHGAGVADTLETHRWLGLAAAACAGAALVLASLASARAARSLAGAYRTALFLAAGLVGIAGHWGGTMVYGDSYLTEAFLPAAPADAPPSVVVAAELTPAERVFATDVASILSARCVECHGPTKRKGKLRLDRAEDLFGPDESRWPVVPFDAAASELVFRVELPEGDEDRMPPKGDPLTPDQIATLRAWIDTGAVWPMGFVVPFDASLASAPDDESSPPPDALPAINAAALASRDAALDALRARGAVASLVAVDSPLVDVRFDLIAPSVTDADLTLLAGLEPTLRSLNLSGAAVTDDGIRLLAAFPRLERLNLSSTAVTDRALPHLATLHRLTYLNLFSTAVTDEGLASVAALPALDSLFLWKTSVSPGAARLLAALRPGLLVDLGLPVVPLAESSPPSAPEPAPAPPAPEPVAAAAPPEAAELPGCCAAAKTRGIECDHPCCVAARAEGKTCPTCAAN